MTPKFKLATRRMFYVESQNPIFFCWNCPLPLNIVTDALISLGSGVTKNKERNEKVD